jgi:protein-S-isoprenylcysteine O-methyltransferase Ste14
MLWRGTGYINHAPWFDRDDFGGLDIPSNEQEAHAAYSHAFWIDDVRNQGWYEWHGNRMGSEGRSWSSRGHTKTRASGYVGASEGFAPVRVVWICALWALIHSILASKQVKDLAHRISGPRYRDGLYRFSFNAQSVVSLLWAARRFSQLPDRELYRVRPPWSWLFRASQAVSLGVLLSGVRVMGILRFAGLTSVGDLLTGRNVRPAPEAQGPPVGSNNEMVRAGAFRFSRHPGNLGALGFFVFLPRMTANRAVLVALVALYVVLGSMHEEYRLRTAYEAAYERYRRAVPFLIPGHPRG